MQGNGDEDVYGNGGHPACASCRHQRKKCTVNCELAPYFPASRVAEFRAVHSVFGVSNVSKILKKIPHRSRQRAVESLVWEAEWRQRDAILGPYSEYLRLLQENHMLRQERQVCRCNNGVAGLNLSNIIIQNDNNMNFIAPPLLREPQDGINYIHYNGGLLLEQNHHQNHRPSYVSGMERGGLQIRNGYATAVPPPSTIYESIEHQSRAQRN